MVLNTVLFISPSNNKTWNLNNEIEITFKGLVIAVITIDDTVKF